MRTFNLISGIDDNGYISNGDNSLLYYNKDDLHRFKTLTKGHTVVMGMNTYKSLGSNPLSGRINVVVTSQAEEKNKMLEDSIDVNIKRVDGSSVYEYLYTLEKTKIVFVESTAKAMELLKTCELFAEEDVFVIGGGQIYQQLLKTEMFDYIYITRFSNWNLQSFLDIDTGNFMGVRFPMYELKENVERCKENGVVVKYSAYPEIGTLTQALQSVQYEVGYKFYRIHFQKGNTGVIKIQTDYTWWPKEIEL